MRDLPMMLGVAEHAARAGTETEVEESQLIVRATRDLDGISTGRFSQPSAGVRWWKANLAHDIEFMGFAFTQFALPVTAGADLDFDFRPAPGLRSPRVVSPLLARTGGRFTLLAPLDQFHEQIIAVTDEGLMWGWHGDLDAVPAGFSTRLGIYEADSVSEALDRWRIDLALDPEMARPTDNPLSTHLSYWTDNGAAYWYRTEAGRTIADSVTDVIERLRANGIPVRSIELDSWFYDHETPRAIAEIGYPEEVPPTGMSTWTPRPDAFSASGPVSASPARIGRFAERLGSPPLVLHSRHIAPSSPYVTGADDWWIDDLAAHPKDPSFFRRWFDDAVRWGATCIEQDWMLMYWFGVSELRAMPDRAAAWQRALNGHAQATDVDLLWCMATPADMMLAASLDRVIAVRTCDDYRFADDPAFLWTWFLTVNRLANTIGLPVFKDCFFSNPHVAPDADAIDGDPHAEVEALLAALSGGPVGIGDRIGRTNREIVMRTCDDDGRIRRVDCAIAAIDDCLFGAPERGDRLMWATTTATTRDGIWTYVVAINTATDRRPIADRLGLDAAAEVFDWRAGTTTEMSAIEVELAPRDWTLFIVCPPGGPGAAEIGDPTKYVVVESDR